MRRARAATVYAVPPVKRSSPASEELKTQAREMAARGLSTVEIGRKLRRSDSTVRGWLRAAQ